MPQLIERNIERHREADGHLGAKPKAVCFVVGDQGLHDADPCGEFDLSESALLADASDTLADGLFAPVEGRQAELRNARHDNASVGQKRVFLQTTLCNKA